MLKLISMPNPFKLAFSNYKMTNTGKVLLGSMVAEAISGMASREQAEEMEQPLTQEQQAWNLYGCFVRDITTERAREQLRQANRVQWEEVSIDMKQTILLGHFVKNNSAYLIPYLQQNIFPTLR